MYLNIFELMKKRPIVAFLHDFKEMKGTFTHLNDWLIETFRPAVPLCFKYEVIVMNDDVFTAFAASDIIKKITMIQVQVFKSNDEAKKWLDEIEKD